MRFVLYAWYIAGIARNIGTQFFGDMNNLKQQNNIPAAYLLLIKNQKILLSRRYNTGYEDGNYALVAGHVEAEESFSQCIIREAREEAGIIIRNGDLNAVHLMHRNSGLADRNERIDVFFAASQWEGTIENKEPDKCSDLGWFEMNNLPTNIIPYIRDAIRLASENIPYSEFGW